MLLIVGLLKRCIRHIVSVTLLRLVCVVVVVLMEGLGWGRGVRVLLFDVVSPVMSSGLLVTAVVL